MTTKRVTMATVKAALPEGVELRKGSGYFYFVGGDSERFEESGVYGGVRLGDMTPDEWRREYDSMRNRAIEIGRIPR